MKDPAIILEYHHRHPVLSETKPITLARVPISDDTWQGSIVLHPRYVPKSVEHESFTARVYRRGRAVDVFLEKPITVNKERYGILNYKGAGADADRDLILHPSLWWQLRNWIPREKGDFPFNRCWGAVKESDGEDEFSDSTLSDYGIAHSPHLAIHPIPEKILRNIERREKGKFPEPLVQIVRAEKTNIRLDYAAVVDEKLERMLDKYCSPETFAAIDSKIILAELELARKGKQLYFQGSVSENRFIDGTLTDKENFSIEDFNLERVMFFLDVLTELSFNRLSNKNSFRDTYARKMQQLTHLPFTRGYDFGFNSDGAEMLKHALLKVMRKRRIFS